MADERLIFPVGFDLDAGVKEAERIGRTSTTKDFKRR